MLLGINDLVAITGLIITIIIFIATQIKSNKNKSTEIIHDMFKTEQEYWQQLHTKKEQKKKLSKAETSQIFNYYEYLAYIILRKKINEKEAFDLWKPNILGIYKDFKKEFSGNTTERVCVKELCERWKNVKEIKKILLFNKKIKK